MKSSYKVIIQEAAHADLRGVWEYISGTLREPVTAARMLDKLEQAILSLREMPQRYSPLADNLLRAKEIRKIPVDNYIVFYCVNETDKSVAVLRVLYGRRDWESLL